MSGKITREHFILAVGREPIDDDMTRSNCQLAGLPMHFACGWDWERDLPRFMAEPGPVT